MDVISSSLPDYRFVAANTLFPGIPDREVIAEQNSVNILNASEGGKFQYACSQWLSDAGLARNNNQPLPVKPVSPPSWVVINQDGVNEAGTSGKYIARQQIGPVYGVCPDLPMLTHTNPSTGTIASGPVQPVTQDQKLDAIMATVLNIETLLKKGLGIA